MDQNEFMAMSVCLQLAKQALEVNASALATRLIEKAEALFDRADRQIVEAQVVKFPKVVE